jgi:hypothetical protein
MVETGIPTYVPYFTPNISLKPYLIPQRANIPFAPDIGPLHNPWKAGRGAIFEVLRYKRKVHGIDSRWIHWNFLLT